MDSGKGRRSGRKMGGQRRFFFSSASSFPPGESLSHAPSWQLLETFPAGLFVWEVSRGEAGAGFSANFPLSARTLRGSLRVELATETLPSKMETPSRRAKPELTREKQQPSGRFNWRERDETEAREDDTLAPARATSDAAPVKTASFYRESPEAPLSRGLPRQRRLRGLLRSIQGKGSPTGSLSFLLALQQPSPWRVSRLFPLLSLYHTSL